ncbi:PD-(D/E)XK nuclease family transposase [uncultured Parabacteroides sp.]|uniref:PD-(D/E)XK nuclease family transposase n=1 Tax=uncultured Parabacteroides sp. TaxID=512312 RepID=UPI0025F7DC1D|nr:PD-(D/E)XK nuclease family transposase [uncultured Parabacteroides sp.]
MPYFTLEAEDCHTDFECWIYLLKHMETLDRMPFEAKKAVFKKLLEVADVENMTPDERESYEESLKAYRDYVNTIATAERISREKALAEGEARGLAKGEAKGKRQMAAYLKKEGLPAEMIARSSGLSIEEIEKL